ncbi:hypothetical protein PsorP6_004703 [Peronosclerospora sorghi]|uniref:Uncharacterized protein n=1 Tax=Peronosclerospora sorghi TaxID=230839 RepID=A0ACC0VMX7_9STRA|nr:hypothetical protein PsorP6_004703 [Peronosclerospora sorghi]
MVSFASPLFWQINYLVTNLSKKNFKSNVAELNQLVELYGEDARIFLLNCLVKDIDFSGQKDALKIQLLTHEVAQASSRPNFTTFICEAIGRSFSDSASERYVTEDFLQLFCKTLKLSLPQQVTVGLAFAQGENTKSSVEAIQFLRSKIPEISSCGAKLPSDVLHSLVFVLRMKKEFRGDVAEADSFLASISSAHPNDMGSLEMAPLTMGDFEQVDCKSVADSSLLSKLISDVSSSCLFYEVMEDVGYSCTSSPQAFRTLLAEAGLGKAPTIPPAQVAGMLAMLSRTYTGLDAKNGATLMANLTIDFEANPSDEVAAAPVQDSWDLDVIADVLHKDYSSIKWVKVAENLDRPDLNIQNATQLRVLVTAFQRFSQTKFRVMTLLRPWKNSRAHINILKAAVEAPHQVLSFSESPHKLAPFEGADASAVPKNGVWFSLDMVETLLQVSEQDCYGDVRKILDGAMKTCPDVLIANLAKASPRWNALRDDMFSELFSSYIMGRPNAPLIMRHLWSVAPKLVLYASVKCFYAATAPHIVSRLFALFRNTGDAFASAIHSNYFSFALALATMGANHDVLNLETWVVERLASQRTAFATSCLAFVHRNYARAVPKSSITPQSSHVLSIESLATILKCIMAVQGALPITISQELKRIITLCMEAHPVISASTRPSVESGLPHVPAASSAAGIVAGAPAIVDSGAGNEPASTGGEATAYTPEMIEEQANAYFQQIYTSEQNINDVVAMLKRFQGSRDERERQIFYCMIHNLFDEYRFFPRYPEMELRITGVLFGKLIEHQVLPPNFLQTALRSVLESLREPVNSKFFFFGACALQQFVPRLRELPSYCTNLSQIPHLQHALPEIMRQVNQVTRSISLSGPSQDASGGTAGSLSSVGGTLPPVVSTSLGDGATRLNSSIASFAGSPPSDGTEAKAQDDIALGVQSILSRSAGPAMTYPSPKAPAVSPPPPATPAPVLKVDHIFHESSKVDEDEVVEQPDENVKDRIHFIVNNMSISNLEAKIPEVRKMLLPVYHAWLAKYLVVKRISTQPNYHTVYLIFIERLVRPELEREILKRTLQNARKLLTSGAITTNSQQRSLLKNLGSWLGVFTLARNKPLLQRDLDLKELLYVGYETGHLIAVTPFVAKILEGCKKSKIFKPPNPWVMGLIHAMSEIYNVPDLKLNLKFEIEVLFKSFKLNVEDQRKTHLLHTRRAPLRTANPDFNVKVPKNQGAGQRSATPPPSSGSKLGRLVTPGKQMKKAGDSFVPAGSPPGDAVSYGSLGVTNSGTTAAESTVIPNLASYVAVNPELPLRNVNLRRLVPLAVDRAIREVISPVVERSVTIACITTREVILKDFVAECDDAKMRKAAHLMVASMSGSLALITAKEPLRNAIGTHLRALLPSSAGEAQQLEHVIQVCSNENTDLGCMLIEKASSEKAMRDIDEALAGAYASRRRYQQQLAQAGKTPGADDVHFFEVSANSTAVAASAGSPGAPSDQWPAALPEVFKPKPSGVPPMQLIVYEAFQRIPRPTSMPLSSRASSGAYPGSSIEKEGDPTGVSVMAALDRFAGLLERFELFVQKVVRQAAASQRELPSLLAVPAESEVFAVLREVRALGGSVRPALRDEACLKIANRIYLQMLKQYGLLADDESVSLFFKFGTELCMDACLKSSFAVSDPAALKAGAKVPLNYAVLDALTHLMALLVKFLDSAPTAKLQVLNHAVGAIANVLVSAHDLSRKKKAPFDQRVFFRMFVILMKELTVQDPALDAIHLQVLNTFASAYNTLQPLGLPGFVFAWTELISHRCFMPLLLRAKQQRGWQILHRLLMNLLVFMEPFLRQSNPAMHLPDSIAALYKGVVRIILVLLHDYPEFLSDFYTSFCDVLPAACVQLRNVILSAFSRSMRLPDPLTLGLHVAQLPEVSVAPRLMPAWGAALNHNGIKEYVDEFLHATANRASVFPGDLISKLLRPAAQLERDPTSGKYMLPALNALVLYLGKEGIAEMASAGSASSSSPPKPAGSDKSGTANTTSKFEQSAAMDVFRFLADELDSEGRYWYFSSLTNHLRYPNSHTHYFSCVILYLFSYSNNKMVKEQITRVLMERLIANRPHPWGLLVTFIELIRNKSYKFWEQEYLECSSEIKEVFDDVARTCLGSTPGVSSASPLASLGGNALPAGSPGASS